MSEPTSEMQRVEESEPTWKEPCLSVSGVLEPGTSWDERGLACRLEQQALGLEPVREEMGS